MKEITDNIFEALLQLKVVKGSNAEVARLFGLSRKHVGNIYKRITTSFEDETWAKIHPHIKKYLNDCDGICKGLSNADKVMIQRYKLLPGEIQEEIIEKVKKETENALKKSNAGTMDNDCSRAKAG